MEKISSNVCKQLLARIKDIFYLVALDYRVNTQCVRQRQSKSESTARVTLFDIAPIAKRIRAETAERWMMSEAQLAHSSNWGSMNACYFENHLLDKIIAGNYNMTLRSRTVGEYRLCPDPMSQRVVGWYRNLPCSSLRLPQTTIVDEGRMSSSDSFASGVVIFFSNLLPFAIENFNFSKVIELLCRRGRLLHGFLSRGLVELVHVVHRGEHDKQQTLLR